MGLFRFPHAWTSIVPADSSLATSIALLDDRDRALEDYLLGGTLTATPTLSQNGSIAVDADSTIRYTRQGSWVFGHVNLSPNAAGTAGNAILVGGLPAAKSSGAAGTFGYFDSGTAWRQGVAFMTDSGSLSFYVNGATDQLGIDPSFAVAAADALYIQFAYEIVG